MPLHLGKLLFLVLAFFQASWYSQQYPQSCWSLTTIFDAGCEEANQRRCAEFIDKLGIVRKNGHNLSFIFDFCLRYSDLLDICDSLWPKVA